MNAQNAENHAPEILDGAPEITSTIPDQIQVKEIPFPTQEEQLKTYVASEIEKRIKGLDIVFQEVGKSIQLLDSRTREFHLQSREQNLELREIKLALKEAGILK